MYYFLDFIMKKYGCGDNVCRQHVGRFLSHAPDKEGGRKEQQTKKKKIEEEMQLNQSALQPHNTSSTENITKNNGSSVIDGADTEAVSSENEFS